MALPQLNRSSLVTFVTNSLVAGIVLCTFSSSAAAKTPQPNPQLTCSPSSLKFGAVDVGHSMTLLTTVANTGQSSVTISSITAGSQFSIANLSMPIILGAGQSFNLNVSFSPTSTGWDGKTIQIVSSASNPDLTLQVAGSGATSVALQSSPSTVTFGQVSVGGKSTLPVVITNQRTWDVTLTSMTTSNSAFSIGSESLPLKLASGQSVTVNVTYAPQSSGTIGGSLSISPSLIVPITGTGSSAVGQLTLAPAPMNFGNVNIGSTGTQSLTLSATGASVTVSSATSGSSQFALQGASLPFTIAAGQSQTFNVTFTPQNSGMQSSTLSFTSNASDSQAVESLSGSGGTPTFSVSLFWNASSDVSGYNVYRSTASNGTYIKLNSSLDSTTAFTDSSVTSGKTYYYTATSVSSSGAESGRSASVQAVIP